MGCMNAKTKFLHMLWFATGIPLRIFILPRAWPLCGADGSLYSRHVNLRLRVLKELFITLLWVACTTRAYPETKYGNLFLKFRENNAILRFLLFSLWEFGWLVKLLLPGLYSNKTGRVEIRLWWWPGFYPISSTEVSQWWEWVFNYGCTQSACTSTSIIKRRRRIRKKFH